MTLPRQRQVHDMAFRRKTKSRGKRYLSAFALAADAATLPMALHRGLRETLHPRLKAFVRYAAARKVVVDPDTGFRHG
jgi:hypothetical protein